MVVRGEVDGGEGDIASQTRRRSLVETAETEVADVPHGSLPDWCHSTDIDALLEGLALDLETDLDDFERIGEDLKGDKLVHRATLENDRKETILTT